MSTWSSILTNSRALLNDQDNAKYTDEVLLAYLNLTLAELQENYELNDISATKETSNVITVPAGETRVAFFGTLAQLPHDLIAIKELFESQSGQDVWIPMVKKDYITPSSVAGNEPVSSFIVFAWDGQEIRLLESTQDNDLKIDYVASLFPQISIGMLGQRVSITNIDTYVAHRVAGYAAAFIDENLMRSNELNGLAMTALNRAMGIDIKTQQVISVRRRPFRAGFKQRNRMW